jgi:hypothetical protein
MFIQDILLKSATQRKLDDSNTAGFIRIFLVNDSLISTL